MQSKQADKQKRKNKKLFTFYKISQRKEEMVEKIKVNKIPDNRNKTKLH